MEKLFAVQGILLKIRYFERALPKVRKKVKIVFQT